jgi:hypothetical protein
MRQASYAALRVQHHSRETSGSYRSLRVFGESETLSSRSLHRGFTRGCYKWAVAIPRVYRALAWLVLAVADVLFWLSDTGRTARDTLRRTFCR